jgi:hypothetical protein
LFRSTLQLSARSDAASAAWPFSASTRGWPSRARSRGNSRVASVSSTIEVATSGSWILQLSDRVLELQSGLLEPPQVTRWHNQPTLGVLERNLGIPQGSADWSLEFVE